MAKQPRKAPQRPTMHDGRRVQKLIIRPDLTKAKHRQQINDLLFRSGLAQLRKEGQYRRVVFGLLAEGIDPSPEDVAAALREPIPDSESPAVRAQVAEQTARLLDYVAATFVLKTQKRKSGRKRGERTLTLQQERQAAADYFIAIENAKHARDNNTRLPRPVIERALRRVSAEYGIKEDTLRAIIANRTPVFSRG